MDIIELTIEDMSVEGKGIGRYPVLDRQPADEDGGRKDLAGMTVFVDGAVLGDRVRAEVTDVKKRFALAKAIEILERSPSREDDFDCPLYEQGCGGCPLGPLDYEAQLELKQRQIKERLERIGGLDLSGGKLKPIIGMEEEDNEGQGQWRYRNKAVFPVSTGGIITRKGGIVESLDDPKVGFYKAGSRDILDCGDCYLQSLAAMAAADALRRFMIEDNITGYDPKWDKGLMKNLMVRTAFGTGEVMVVLGIKGKGIPGVSKLIEMLDDAVAQVGYSLESVVINNGRYETIAGKPTIVDEVGRLSLEISPASFYQVNPVQMKRLYDKVREYCIRGIEEKRPKILDLYCGIGSIGLYCADIAESVMGVETVKDAVIDANRNATINGIVNARYICGKAEKVLMEEDICEDADIAIFDPPRAGCRPELLDAVAFAEIPSIIYVSCDPGTLARDLKILTGHGYQVVEVTPVDMFSGTVHCECVSLLSKA